MSSTRNKPGLQYSATDWKPEPYMKRGVKFLLEHAGAGLLLDPGMGKTSIALAAFKILQKEGVAERALVVAPRRPAALTWPGEIEKWRDFEHFSYEFLHGAKKNQLIREAPDIFTINPEGLQWLLTKPKLIKREVEVDGKVMMVQDTDHVYDPTKFKMLGVDTLIVDESTKFKRTTSQRYKYLKPFLGKFGRRWILTGTPAPNGLLDLFGQIYIVDLGASFGEYFTGYRNKYFRGVGFGEYKWIPMSAKSENEIFKRARPYVMRLDAADYIKLPEKRDNAIYVDLPLAARKAYNEMEADLFTKIDKHVVAAVSAGVGSMKCEQIASGMVYKELEARKGQKLKDQTITVHTEKLEAVVDFIEQRQGKPTAIMYQFRHEAHLIHKALGGDKLKDGLIVTETTTKEEHKMVDDWNHDRLRYLLIHPGVSYGLNIQEGSCDALFWYTLPWDLELYMQMWRRFVRRGSKHKRIMNHRCEARGTIDEIKWAALGRKGSTQKRFLDAVKEYRSKK